MQFLQLISCERLLESSLADFGPFLNSGRCAGLKAKPQAQPGALLSLRKYYVISQSMPSSSTATSANSNRFHTLRRAVNVAL